MKPLPHATLNRLMGLIETMSQTPGPDSVKTLAQQLHLDLDDLLPLLSAARLFGWAVVSGGRYDLTIWPYHAMLGGIGYALVSSVEEAVFFHSIARQVNSTLEVKAVLRNLLQSLIEELNVKGAAVRLLGPRGKRLHLAAAHAVEQLGLRLREIGLHREGRARQIDGLLQIHVMRVHFAG